MKVIDEKEVLKVKEELRKLSLEELRKSGKNYDSLICRRKKMEFDVDEMDYLLLMKRMIREVIIEKEEKKSVIYERLEAEIKVMNIEEVMKGIKNVDSIKCIELSKKEEMRSKEKLDKLEVVREWLLKRKEEISGNSLGKVNISDVLRKIEDCKDLEELKNWLVEKSK
jgi:hypothetical protein